MAKCKVCGNHGLLLKVNSEGKCLDCVTKELKELSEKVTPEMTALVDVNQAIAKAKQELDKYIQQEKDAKRNYKESADQLNNL